MIVTCFMISLQSGAMVSMSVIVLAANVSLLSYELAFCLVYLQSSNTIHSTMLQLFTRTIYSLQVVVALFSWKLNCGRNVNVL